MAADLGIISDTHFPFEHPDTFSFLQAIKDEYKPRSWIHVGDEVDYHAISFHESDPDLPSPGDELFQARQRIEKLSEIVPTLKLLESNHGSLVMRRQRTSGLSSSVFKTYHQILGAPRGWSWHHHLVLTLPNKSKVYCHHGLSKAHGGASSRLGMHSVEGHFHTEFGAIYRNNGLSNLWSLKVGCLVDQNSIAFRYAKNNMWHFVIGCAVVVDGHPVLLKMKTDKFGRWTGKM